MDSTLAGITATERGLLSRLATRGVILLLVLACGAGLAGVLGGRTSTVEATRDGYHLDLSYPETTRPGLDTYWTLTLVHRGGFQHPVVIAVTAAYFDLFETQGFFPTPAGTTRDGSYVYMTFTPPSHGDVLTVSYDSYLQPYIEPSRLLRNPATVAVVRKGRQVARVHYTTWVLP